MAAIEERRLRGVSSPRIELVVIDDRGADEGAQIRARRLFRAFAAIQLAAAKIARVDAFVTHDARLRTFDDLKVCVLNDYVGED